jgi:hypothetical protein
LVLANDYDVLRVAVEALALRAIERGSLEDLEASNLIRAAVNVHRPMTVLDDLVRAGILQRRATSRPFALPTVQEYLAGCALARGDDADRTGGIRTRPWNQAVQFALERLPDATSMAERLLGEADDAYQTNLRVVARSIANGATVRRELRESVGTALASWWFAAPSYFHAEEAADLLARGWKHNLPPSVLAAARGERRWNYGVDTIVAAVARADVTLARLRTRLAREPYLYHLHQFQPALDAVAEDTLELYLQTARSAEDGKRAEQLASLIEGLGGDISASAERHLEDERLPPIVRLALALKQHPVSRDVVDSLVCAVARATERLPILVDRALARVGWPIKLVRELLTQLPPNEVHEIAEAIKEDGALASEDKRRLLTAVCADAPPSPRIAVKLVLADLGDEAMINEMLGGWDQLDGGQQTYFAASLARQERVDALRGVLARVKDPKAAAGLAHLLAFAVQYQTTLHGIGTARGATRRVAHPMQAEISVWLWQHALACTVADTRRELLRAAAELGHIESRREIRIEIGSALREGRPLDDWSLQTLEDCGQLLELPELARAASLRDAPNSSAAAMRAIGRRGTPEALETLLQLQRGELRPFARETLEETVERLAAQLGISVERDAAGLLRAATA